MTDGDRGVVGGRYQVIASLGKGGMGQVYKAYDPILDRTVALKKMIATVVDSEEGRQRFYIEARAAARLNHPNIVTIHELEEYAGDIYIVMELLDGVSLAAFMRARMQMPLAGYLTIITQIAEGLHYAHKRGIVHRDIKPPNLVLTTSGNLKVLDFGIARLASNEITKKGKLLGTPHYMAPEQVIEEAVDSRADLFSLGAVAYELVTGIKPFTADSIPALLMQITSTPHRPVLEVAPETEPALAAIIDRLLAKDRTQRFGTGMELVAALDLIGEVDRIDFVAEAVAAVMGPSGEATIYAPIGSTPQPGMPTPTPTPIPTPTPPTPSSVSPAVVPLFGATPPNTSASPVSTPASANEPPPFGVTPPVTRLSKTWSDLASPASSSAKDTHAAPGVSADDATLSLSAPVRAAASAEVEASASKPASPAASTPVPPAAIAPHTPPPVASSSADAPTQVDLEALPKPEASPRSVTLDTRIGAPPPLPEGAVARPTPPVSAAPSPAPPAPPSFAPVPPPRVVMPSAVSTAKTPPASAPPPELADTIAARPPTLPGSVAASGVTPHADKPGAPAGSSVAMPSHGGTAAPSPSAPPPELADTIAARPPTLPGSVAASGVTPHFDKSGAPAVPSVAMPSHGATAATSSNVPPSASARADAPPSVPAAAMPAVAATSAAASAGGKTPASSAPRGFVNAGVPQARHRSGAGAAVVVIGLLLLPAVVAVGWWAFNSVRGALQTRTTTDTTSPSAVKDAASSAQKPTESQAPTTDQASQPNQANAATDPNQAKPAETPAETPNPQQASQTPAVDANAATSTEKPPESQPPARPVEATPSQTATATQPSQSQPNQSLPANQANANQTPPPDASRTAPANQANASQLADARRTAQTNPTPGANQASDATRDARNGEPAPARDAVTDRTREVSPETVVRDATRENTRATDARREPQPAQPPQRNAGTENTRREPSPPVRETTPAESPREPSAPSTPADTRSLDYGSLSAFRGGSRGTGSASNVYTDSPSAAAAVARITYTLEAYGDAIAARDLDALRDVRSPVTPAESTMLKEGRLTVRFSNFDVSLDGNDARVRCRRAVVANGKTLSSGPADVRLTRRPEGWVITDIR